MYYIDEILNERVIAIFVVVNDQLYMCLMWQQLMGNTISMLSRLTVVRRAAKKLRSARPIKRRGHYCELFTCRVCFAILALDYATSLNGFVLHCVIKKSLFVVVFLRLC